MSTCRRRTIQLSKNLECRKRRFSSDLVATETTDVSRQPPDAGFDARLPCFRQHLRAAGSANLKLSLKPDRRQNAYAARVGATACGLPRLGLLGIRLETGGKVLVGVMPTCFKTYPKAFFVSTSR